MSNSLPNAKSASSPQDRALLRRLVAERNLCGLANDTKWDELLTAMHTRKGWRPGYRYQCLDGPPSRWDTEWSYHLPFPMLSIEWLDLSFRQETRESGLPPRVTTIDHSLWLEALLQRIGLEYQKGRTAIRVFGYSPKNLNQFEAAPTA